MHLALALLALLVVQPPNVAGTWTVTYDSDLRTAGGKSEVRARREGTLVLAQRGDSLFGTWAGMPGEPLAVTGRVDGATVRFGSAWRGGSVRINGKAADGAEMRTEFHGTLARGALAGTMYVRLRFDGVEREPPARRWEAARRPAG
jgi:hypothetical protein